MAVTCVQKGHIGYVKIDNPPVNAINHEIRAGLLEAVSWAESHRLDRVILYGAGRVFAAGADVREFDAAPQEPNLPDVLDAIDQSWVPWIAALNGVALGGGAEIAMACRMRIAAPSARIGLPEVTLGLIPGAGGTARLPRLVGLSRALEMITGGKPLSSKDALEAGLIHMAEDDPAEAAFMVNTEELGCIVPTWELPAPPVEQAIIESAREKVTKRALGQIAPLRALDTIAHGLTVPFHEALKTERETFLKLREGEQTKALRHLFFAERGAKPPANLNAEPVKLDHVAVVGGGTMGAGIAYSLLQAGLTVTLLETDADAIDRATQNIDKIILASTARGLIGEAQASDFRNRLTLTTEYAEAGSATLAIEAAFENMDVKRKIFAQLEAAMPTDAILATNTSYLDINEIAASLSDPSRVLGLHFFAPAYIMKLLEIVQANETSPNALATGYMLGKRLGKIPVRSGVCDGFIGNRILARYREAADTVLMDGSTPWDVDNAMVEFGYAMGPYEAQDLSGLDIAHSNRRRKDSSRDPKRRYIPIADRMVELGKLGRKTGAGWYRYPGGGGKVEDPIVADLALEEARLANITRSDYSAAEIEERLVLAMINEAADILDEGIAQSASDIDLVTVLGYGFPRWRGGLLHYADTLGAAQIVKKLQKLGQEDPVAWKISPLLERCVAMDKPISEAGSLS